MVDSPPDRLENSFGRKNYDRCETGN
jgi:hypothetical protein